MSDWFFKQGGRDKLINWLGIDSKIDSTISTGVVKAQESWNAWSSFFARFRLSGWRRIANELASEAVTLGAGGVLILYAFALPALITTPRPVARGTRDRVTFTGAPQTRFCVNTPAVAAGRSLVGPEHADIATAAAMTSTARRGRFMRCAPMYRSQVEVRSPAGGVARQ